MAVRKIEFTVSTDSIEPAVKQFAGVQGDHKATEVVFNIAPELYRNLTTQATNGARLIYRFDGYDGEGGFKSSDTFELTETTVSYLLEEWLTRFGGVVKVVLVISILKNDLTEMELFNFPALLQLKNRPEGVETDGENYESISTLAQVAKDSANVAVDAKNSAMEAQDKTERAKAALENGTVWVFDGGDAEGNVDLDGDGIADVNAADIKFVVDNEMSDNSENAVMNKVIKAYVDNVNMSVSEVKQTTNENEQKIENIFAELNKYDDYVIEQGTNGVWTYRKWASGIAECWCRKSSTEVAALDSEYCYIEAPLPITFITHPNCGCTAFQMRNLKSYLALSTATEDTIQAYMWCQTPPSDNAPCWFNFDVKGRWK